MMLRSGSRDWLLAFALTGMLLRSTLMVWGASLLAGGDFVLLCTSQGMQWVSMEGEQQVAEPCAQCATQVSTLPTLAYLPPVPASLSLPPLRLEAQVLRWYPPFLLAPPNRAPPRHA